MLSSARYYIVRRNDLHSMTDQQFVSLFACQQFHVKVNFPKLYAKRTLRLTSVSTIRQYRRSCQAAVLAQVATDGRGKDNAHIVSWAFALIFGGIR